MTKHNRTKELLDILDGNSIKNVKLTGVIKNYDFKDISFGDCILYDVLFSNCDFNEGTVFTKSRMRGKITFDNCTGVKNITKIIECSIDPDTRDMLYGVIDSVKMTPQQIERWMYDFLKKFKSGVFYIKLGFNQLFRGIVFQKIDRTKFLERMRYHNIIEIELGSAGDEELCIISSDARRDVSEYLENGIISGRIKRLHEDLVRNFI